MKSAREKSNSEMGAGGSVAVRGYLEAMPETAQTGH
jgi:hypothetical protein